MKEEVRLLQAKGPSDIMHAYPNSIDMKEIHKKCPKKSDFYLTRWQNNKAVMLAFSFCFLSVNM